MDPVSNSGVSCGAVTQRLRALRSGDAVAHSALLDLVYGELRRIAQAQMEPQRRRVTLQPTALVHEAYLKLLHGSSAGFRDRKHFYRAAALAMRSVLVDLARSRATRKRSPDGVLFTIRPDDVGEERDALEVLAVHDALQRLERIDPDACRVVELRFFAGLSVAETAAVVGVKERTIYRAWQAARAWLHRELSR